MKADLADLNIFLAVAQARGFREAARISGASPQGPNMPTISRCRKRRADQSPAEFALKATATRKRPEVSDNSPTRETRIQVTSLLA
jgi:hypothetical protein